VWDRIVVWVWGGFAGRDGCVGGMDVWGVGLCGGAGV
jgi:hypothetical protein